MKRFKLIYKSRAGVYVTYRNVFDKIDYKDLYKMYIRKFEKRGLEEEDWEQIYPYPEEGGEKV